MRKNRTLGGLLKTLAGFAAAGTMFAAGCSLEDLRAIAAGVDAIVEELDQSDEITFGDFLLSQFDD